MKKTLLRIVQDILYDMDSDEVDSIGDTVESVQVARKVENVYWDLITRLNLPEQKSLFELEPSNNILQPTLMYRPEKAASIEFVKYDRSTDSTVDYVDITYLDLKSFLKLVNGFDKTTTTTGSFIATLGSDTFTFYFKNDYRPNYYTTFDDNTLIFDAYDSTVDTTLMGNKSMAFGTVIPTFSQDDSFVPDLDPDKFALFYQEAKKACFEDIKQMASNDAEKRSRKQWVHSQIDKQGVKDTDLFTELHKLPNYGRRR